MDRPTFNNVSELKGFDTDISFNAEGDYDLEIYLDRSSIEVLFLGGLYSMTNLEYPLLHAKGITVWIDDP